MSTPNAYDEILYHSRPYAQTHPDRLAVLARLHGLEAPAVETARVLDLGAGEGMNIINMAITLPKARFTGVELAAVPVERGNEAIHALGLGNVRLVQMDLLKLDPALGEFDYIIAHGLYAWTPPEVKDKVLAIIHDHLSAKGVAFVSYNTHPGGHVRRALRDAMMFNNLPNGQPRKTLTRARAVLELIAAERPNPAQIERAYGHEARELLTWEDSGLYHDYLAPVYEPVYFREFARHAAKHQLQYLDDASVIDTFNITLRQDVIAMAHSMAGPDRLDREQLLDILRIRHFRQSLVCHAGQPIFDEWNPPAAAGFHCSIVAKQVGEQEFESPAGVKITTQHPDTLDLLQSLTSDCPVTKPVPPGQEQMAAQLFQRGMIELHTIPGAAKKPGEMPVANPVARYQIERKEFQVATLTHRVLELKEPVGRRFLQKLDGTRDRRALAREFDSTLEIIENKLDALARHGMLLA